MTIEIGPFSSLFYDLFPFIFHFPAVRPLLRNLRLSTKGGAQAVGIACGSRRATMAYLQTQAHFPQEQIRLRRGCMLFHPNARCKPSSGPTIRPRLAKPKVRISRLCPPFHPPLLLTERCKTPPRSKSDRSENLPCHTSLRS